MPFRVRAEVAELVGREQPCLALGALLDAARSGAGGALLLTGEPGVGKTALLAHLMSGATGVTVLATTGLESEASLPYAGLGDLLHPLLTLVPRLPRPQSRALRAALALADQDRDLSPYAVCLATLALLTTAAEREPVLVVVDDAHWIDEPSRAALLFAARRLAADPVAMVLATRDDPAIDTGCDALHLAGLSRDASTRLLDRHRPGHTAPGVADQLWRATGGNPLALADAADALTDSQLAGAAPLPEPLPIRAGLQQAFATRVAGLPEATRSALLAVALSASADTAFLHAAVQSLGAGRGALAEAEAAGLIRRDDRRLGFTHPLLRTAVQRGATVEERRRAYEALAATATGGERAWYLAADVLGPDERAAGELTLAAGEMRRRTAYGDAARALHRAAELTADPAARSRLLLAAAADAQLAGGLSDAATWLGQARLLVTEPRPAADIALAQGSVLTRRGTPSIAQRVLVDAAEAVLPADPGRAATLLRAAVDPALIDGRFRDAYGYARRAADLAGEDPAARIALAQTRMFTGDLAASRAVLHAHAAYLDTLDPVADAHPLSLAGLCLCWLEEYRAADRLLTRVITATRRAGALSPLIRALSFEAELRRCTGDWPAGYVAAEESLRLARELQEVSSAGFAQVVLARFDAFRGRPAPAARRLAEARRIAGPLGTPGLLPFEGSTRGALHLATGEPQEAVACLEAVREFCAHTGLDFPDFLPWAADLVEAYRCAGQREPARDRLDEFAARTAGFGLTGVRAAVDRCRALLADDPAEAEAHLRAALSRFERVAQPFEAARTRLLLARTLRRNRRRAEARPLLRDALTVFEQLDAVPFARQATAELAAAGERSPVRTESPMHLLTPQELQVARAVAEGRSNPEVAAALFISRKTVESHLSSAYRKLGLNSRTQLVRHLTAVLPPLAEAPAEPEGAAEP
ncbi:transcriptional regulator [Actinoplanes ianthinogenes]|uniref:Transcriptional regulator n=1 Tax=Actinoplanes ianthinogenes TaxID=122358 RepID=A0ABM7LL08_9ACTN|nr:LuxR family transcriptional regulator [Actinoplanes ianthinogenes]BCJ39843.1 transcriptional regulator [Actinoplanes ianthinogenes]GGR08528.1 transcriptional regulator [Actinoplanes ianthinogenes]